MGSVHGYEVVSSLPLRRLSGAPGSRGRIRLNQAREPLLDRLGELTAWVQFDGPGQLFALARTDRGLLGWCSATGAFELDAAAATVTIDAGRLDEAWEHRLGTTAVPLLLAERGDLALHACAVAVDGRAALFCGPSGRGKSTLALMAARLGCSVLSEDGVVVGAHATDPAVWPGPRGIQVSDRAGQPKRLRMLDDRPEPTGPVPVVAICHLAERGTDLSVTRLSPADALASLAPNLIHAGGPDSLRPSFGLLAAAVQRTALYRAAMPDRMSEALDATLRVLDRVLDGCARPALLRSARAPD